MLFAQSHEDQKAIQAVSANTDALSVSFTAEKSNYDVNEPIRFNVQGNKPFFLYVYTQNSDNSYTLILPNNFQTEKQNRYTANVSHAVPNKNVLFLADGTAQVETVYAIASTRFIDLKDAKNRQVGDFTRIDQTVMEEKFAERGINIRIIPEGQTEVSVNVQETSQAQPTQVQQTQVQHTQNQQPQTQQTSDAASNTVTHTVVLSRLDLNINGATEAATSETVTTPAAAEAAEPAIVFVNTDKTTYTSGGKVRIVYGADKAGLVRLYLIDPDGSGGDKPVHESEVDGNSLYKLQANHQGATGEHIIRAVFVTQQSKDLVLDQSASSNSIVAEQKILVK